MNWKDWIDEVCGDPSFDHLNAKLFALFLAIALAGLVLASVVTGPTEEDKMLRHQRPARTLRVVRANQLRNLRKRAA